MQKNKFMTSPTVVKPMTFHNMDATGILEGYGFDSHWGTQNYFSE